MPNDSPEKLQSFSLKGREQVETAWTVVNMTGMAPTTSQLLEVLITLPSNPDLPFDIGVGGEQGNTMHHELVKCLGIVVENVTPDSQILESAKNLLKTLSHKPDEDSTI